MTPTLVSSLDFSLPPELEAHQPPEARGLARDQVRLMVSHRHNDHLVHAQFRDIGEFLRAGDLLVINTSGTLPAALPASRADGSKLRLHLSTRLPDGSWTVELRKIEGPSSKPFAEGRAGETLHLPGGARVVLLSRYAIPGASTVGTQDLTSPPGGKPYSRLWVAALSFPEFNQQRAERPHQQRAERLHQQRAELASTRSPIPYLLEHGQPIRYGYVQQEWPLSYYQTVYATELGSAEMPSAGRAFTPEIITRLVAKGVLVVPLLLHTGVASLEDHEPPYEEYYRVPKLTAEAVNQAKAEGRRVIAVGTTVVRALETVTGPTGWISPGEGWTQLLVTPERGVRAVDGILTGWHEPKATHLAMLEAIAGRRHLDVAYRAALEECYLWHEFGDLHLILP